MAYRVSIDAREVSKNLEKLSLNYTKRVSLETERTATEMENYAKSNRPWKDRTGNARRSIYSVGMRQGGVFRIYTGMGVDYAKYLELYNGGKYRIIRPTVNKYRSIWIRNLKNILEL